MSTRVRVLAGFGAAVLALSLAACGSEADKDQNATGSSATPAADGAADDSGSQECPDKHEATVEDDVFGGTADIDICALPDIHETTLSASWSSVNALPQEIIYQLNIVPVSCKSDSEDSCTQIRSTDNRDNCTPSKPNCHPKQGEEVSVVCSAEDNTNASTRWYGVLLNKRLLATGTDNGDISGPKHYTDKGSKPIGYIEAKNLNKVPGDLPVCDGTTLHGKMARNLAQLEGVPLGL
ncbi:hypothetical protein JIX56_04100 [Streptomyces sp. CA-210063]|uniref:hypothetical protein n=1 Tax=Streptomyces sp. CA-210063 TaxID=2801029 RepID=UPI00214C6213|nr:hypothetical protein [Streptomyces sp. CA-210063]UUU29147.1 hypothetical protein JIX56_04100 [Streptomyces sp. CA-210063]